VHVIVRATEAEARAAARRLAFGSIRRSVARVVAGAGRRAVAGGGPVGLAVGFLSLRGPQGLRGQGRLQAVAAGDAGRP
jgi:hypothetical protein